MPVSDDAYIALRDRMQRLENEHKRVSNLLSEVAGCGISRTADGRYHEVQIPLELWDEIKEATQCERDKQKR